MQIAGRSTIKRDGQNKNGGIAQWIGTATLSSRRLTLKDRAAIPICRRDESTRGGHDHV
jgi:hypothetical protein